MIKGLSSIGSVSTISRSSTGGDFSASNGEDTFSFPRSGSWDYTQSKLATHASIGIVLSTAVVPNYHPRGSIEELQVQTTTPILKDLLKRKKIKVASVQRFGSEIDILNERKSLVLVHVVPNRIINNEKFLFSFDLLFGPYHNVAAHNDDSDDEENKYNDNNNDGPQLQRQRQSNVGYDAFDTSKFSKVYYFYELNVHRKQLKLIHDTTIKEMSEGKEYFARKKYPGPHKKTQTKRSKRCKKEMKEEDNYLLLPNLPKGKSIFHKKADWNDCVNYASYLEKLFSSSPLCIQDYIFNLLVIDPELKKLIQHKAGTRLRTLRNIADMEFIKNPYKLTRKKGKDYHFHTLYIAQRPLRITDTNFSPVNFDHWALKFEGKKNLLTVEFFDEADSNHGIVKIRIIPNTRLNRRVWWYWWEQDPEIAHINGQKQLKPKPQYFTKRWETIWKVWLNCITAECIGKLIIRWLQTNDYAIYQVAKNNCQHFVRDITASLDISAAKKLNSLFDHKVIASVLPAVAVADGMTEEVRMYEIRDILIDEINRYNETVKRRNQNKNGHKLHKSLRSKEIDPYKSSPYAQSSPYAPKRNGAPAYSHNGHSSVKKVKSRPFAPRSDVYSPKSSPPNSPKVRHSRARSGAIAKNDNNVNQLQHGHDDVIEEDEEKWELLPKGSRYDETPNGDDDDNNNNIDNHNNNNIEDNKNDEMNENAPDLMALFEGMDNCEAFFVEEDKSRMIEHMENSNYNDKWYHHFQIVRDYINSPKNMDPERIISDIRSPQNTKLIDKLKEKKLSDIDEFIQVLFDTYKDFILEEDSSISNDTNANHDDDDDDDDQVIINMNQTNDNNKIISHNEIQQNTQKHDNNNFDIKNDINSEEEDEKVEEDEKYNAKSESEEDFHENEDSDPYEHFDDFNQRTELDKLYCNGSCGNTFADYRYYGIKQVNNNNNNNNKNIISINEKDKLSVIARCFLSPDYELRIELISLIEKHYFIQYHQRSKSIPNDKTNNVIIDEMLIALKDENEYFEIDDEKDKDQLKWVKKFDSLFAEFIKTNKSFILNELCLKACRRAINITLLEEFQQNSSKLRVEMKYISQLKKSKIYKKLSQNGHELNNNEIMSLYTFIKYQNELFKEKINSCKWKQLYTNLVNGIKKIHDGLSIQATQFPLKLYCYTNQTKTQKDKSILIINSATYWSTQKIAKRVPGGKLLELNDVKEFLFHHNKSKCSIVGVPVDWIFNNNGQQPQSQINPIQQWILMPFIASSTDKMEKKGYEALFNVDQNNTNSFIIMNAKYWG